MTLDELLVGRDSCGRVVVRNAGSDHLDPDDAAWLRDRLDEELALLDGGEISTGEDVTVSKESGDAAASEFEERIEEANETSEVFACEECGESFESERGKNIHRTKTHSGDEGEDGDENDKHECPTCGDVFDSAVGMKVHHSRKHDNTADEAGENEDDRDDVDGGPEPEPNQSENGANDAPVLDHERVATAMDSLGIDESVATGDVVHAVDVHNKVFQVASQLDIPRADAADLIRRLGLEDALDSDGGLAAERFESDEGGASA